MKRNFTPLTALIFILLAAVGSANAGDCMKLCDGSFWRKNPTLADLKAEIAKGADIHDDIAGYTPLHFAARESTPDKSQPSITQQQPKKTSEIWRRGRDSNPRKEFPPSTI